MLDRERDNHWLGKLARLINETPGISLAQLSLRTKRLTSDERRGYLKQLADAGRIRWDEVEHDDGPNAWHFWPIDQATAPTATPGHQATAPTATPAVQAAKQLDDARRLLNAGLECVDAALRIVSDLAAPAGGPMPAPDRGPVGVELRAGDAAMAV